LLKLHFVATIAAGLALRLAFASAVSPALADPVFEELESNLTTDSRFTFGLWVLLDAEPLTSSLLGRA
jgi:hypothetical protein